MAYYHFSNSYARMKLSNHLHSVGTDKTFWYTFRCQGYCLCSHGFDVARCDSFISMEDSFVKPISEFYATQNKPLVVTTLIRPARSSKRNAFRLEVHLFFRQGVLQVNHKKLRHVSSPLRPSTLNISSFPSARQIPPDVGQIPPDVGQTLEKPGFLILIGAIFNGHGECARPENFR